MIQNFVVMMKSCQAFVSIFTQSQYSVFMRVFQSAVYLIRIFTGNINPGAPVV